MRQRYFRLEKFDDANVEMLLKGFMNEYNENSINYVLKEGAIVDFFEEEKFRSKLNYYDILIHYIACVEELNGKEEEYYTVLYKTKFLNYDLSALQDFTNMFIRIINE